MLGGIERFDIMGFTPGAFDPRPMTGSPALNAGLDEPGDGFFSDVSFKGAFDDSVNWASAWTIMGQSGLMSNAGAAEPAYPAAQGKTITVMDGGVNDIKGNAVWRKGDTYLLEGRVFVEAGESLTIEPGVVIKGKAGSDENAAALIVARGGKIFAEGTAAEPIIFTSEDDLLEANPNKLPTDRGLWGGLIVLGNATLNSPTASGSPITDQVEGIPSDEPRGNFGGVNDDDNSGVLKYISIRHGGVSIGNNNEINGLTLGGVGRGTTVEFIEVYANLDDGIEFFGGTVGVKYAVVAYCGDDSFDYDQGWRGKGQFWLTIGDDSMGNGGEHDGDVDDFTKLPLSNPLIYNVTYIGPGSDKDNDNDALRLRENAAGKYYNSIFMSFGDQAVRIDGDERVVAGDLDLRENIFHDFRDPDIASADADIFFTDMSYNNQQVDPMLGGIERFDIMGFTPGGFDPRPMTGSPALNAGLDEPGDGFFSDVSFKGAFDDSVNWASAWTILGKSQLITDDGAAEPAYPAAQGQEITVMDGGANDIKGNAVWRKGNTYLLEGRVFVEAGESLTIEPGVVIKGKAGSDENAAALIVARGGKIFAEGTAAEPIIFTSEDDLVGDMPNKLPTDRGLWGGLIVLGSARLNSPAASGSPITDQIEGIPSMEPRGNYGGDNDDDNSGVIRYVSIRHGGVSIGNNNEINGLTLGGVGRGTTIEFVEVYANLDDGIEFFGGTAEVKYAVVAYCGDDSFDYDQGWRGKGQFWLTIGDNSMGHGGEHDGDVDDQTKTPLTKPSIYNVTYIGPGSDQDNGNHAVFMREHAGGLYANSIFTGFAGQAIHIADSETAALVTSGDLNFLGNIFHDFKAGTTEGEIATANAQVFFTDATRGNRITDPMLTLIDRSIQVDEAMRLDPRPMNGSPAFSPTHLAPAGDSFFTRANYVGAFSASNWAAGWTILNKSFLITGDGLAVPVPLELAFTPSPAEGKLTLGFHTGIGIAYQLQSSDSVDGPWTDVGDAIQGNGNFHAFEAIIGMEPAKFYRIVEQ